MLITTCTQCGARFKVHHEQLNIRQGRVACGRCRHVFNAFEGIQRIEQPDEPVIPVAPVDSRSVAAPPAEQVTKPAESIADLINTEFVALAPAVEAEKPSPNTPAATHREMQQTLPVDEQAPGQIAQENANNIPVEEQLPISESATSAATEEQRVNALSSLSPRPYSRKTQCWWALGIAVMVIVMVLQGLYTFRNDWVQMYPQTRPVAVTLCEWLGCALSWGRDGKQIFIDSSDLIEAPGKPGHILLTATLSNRHVIQQEFPAIELRLTDNANQVLTSRILRPTDYLGHEPKKDEALPPNAELFINLHLEVGSKPAASGYALRPFYP